MRPVYQTIPAGDPRRGDCLRACVASLLELPTEAVPHYMEHFDWRERLNSWLEEERGLSLLEVNLEEANAIPMYPLPPRTKVIVAGTTHRHPTRLHAVVAETFGGDWNWRYLHDPHPDGRFLITEERLYLFTVTDPKERR